MQRHRMNGYPSSAALREQIAVDAARALRPAYPLLIGSAFALFTCAAVLVWLALERAELYARLAERV